MNGNLKWAARALENMWLHAACHSESEMCQIIADLILDTGLKIPPPSKSGSGVVSLTEIQAARIDEDICTEFDMASYDADPRIAITRALREVSTIANHLGYLHIANEISKTVIELVKGRNGGSQSANCNRPPKGKISALQSH